MVATQSRGSGSPEGSKHMRPSPLFVVALIGVLAAAAFGAACKDGDGGALSLEEYFQQLDEAQNEVDQRFEEAFQQLEPGPDASEEDIAAFARQVVQTFSSVLGDAEGTIGGLEPPAEAEDAHNALVQAIGDASTAIEGVEDDIPDALSLEEVDAVLGTTEVEAATAAIDEACSDLQAIADDNGIDVDLECEDEA